MFNDTDESSMIDTKIIGPKKSEANVAELCSPKRS